MDLKQVKELIALMERSGIKKLMIKQKSGEEVHLERQDEQPSHPQQHPATFYPHAVIREADLAHRPSPVQKPGHEEPSSNKEQEGQFVLAPLVGTFYAATSPEDPPLVKVGDRVDENTVVCIIEAMKVMNEVKAGISGIVEEVLIDNAHPVEFGTKLFRICTKS